MSRPSIGLALSGGAARGIAHVGVLKAFEEHHIPIDYVAGTSAGSIVGAAFAGGMAIADIEKLSRELRWRKIGRMAMSRHGIQSNERLADYVRKRLPITRFEELLIPFAAVATDLRTGTAVVMKDKGDVPFALRASCCIPGFYVPVIDSEGRQLVDGGLVAVIPSIAVRELGADIVIAVDVNSAGATFLPRWISNSAFGVMVQAMLVVQKTASQHQRDSSDVVITPEIGHIRWDAMGRAAELVELGYKAGSESIPAIQRLLS